MSDNNSRVWKWISFGSLAFAGMMMGNVWNGAEPSAAQAYDLQPAAQQATPEPASAPPAAPPYAAIPQPLPVPPAAQIEPAWTPAPRLAAQITGVADAAPHCAGRKRNPVSRFFRGASRVVTAPFRGRRDKAPGYVPPGGNSRQVEPQELVQDDTVELCIAVGEDGFMRQVTYLGGPSALLGPAVDAVRQWRYRPRKAPKRDQLAFAQVSVRVAPAGY